MTALQPRPCRDERRSYNQPQNVVGEPKRRGLAFLRHQVMGLVDDQPMRPPGASAQRGDIRHECCEETRPLLEFKGESVDDDVGLRLGKQLRHLFLDWRRCRIADRHRTFQSFVIAFGVEDAELDVTFVHAFGQSRYKRRFADA